MLNLVIKMDKGKIYDIIWDNGCFTCGGERCQKDIVAKSIFNANETFSYENCYEKCNLDLTGDKIDKKFEPKFYITWFGSDIDKRQLKTAGLAMTKFKPYISESFKTSIKDLF
jgi:hypothetical protein